MKGTFYFWAAEMASFRSATVEAFGEDEEGAVCVPWKAHYTHIYSPDGLYCAGHVRLTDEWFAMAEQCEHIKLYECSEEGMNLAMEDFPTVPWYNLPTYAGCKPSEVVRKIQSLQPEPDYGDEV